MSFLKNALGVRSGCRFAMGLLLLGALASGLSESAWARFTPAPCRNAYTPEQEISEGQKAKAQVYKSMPVLPDSSPVSQYVRRLGAKLAAQAPVYGTAATKWPFEFHVVNVADINAFALPGGPVFINLGTVRAAETEGQLAGVMAHEISHVVQRHATCNITKEQAPSALLGLGQLAAGIFLPGTAGAIAQAGIGLGGQTFFLRMSRDAEKQADLMGTDILYDANYDPRGMPQFFEVIEGKYGKGGAQWLSDHPNPGNRIGYVQDEIDTLPRKPAAVRNTEEFNSIQKQAAALRVYTAQEVQSGVWKRDSPNQTPSGSAAGQVQSTVSRAIDFTPSSKYTALDTAQYRLGYPDNWQAAVNGDAATIAPRGGVLPGGGAGDSVVYGVLVDRFAPEARASLSTNFSQLAQGILQQNAGLRQSGSAEDLVVNQAPARGIHLTGQSPMTRNGVPVEEHDWLVAIERPDGSLNYLVFIAPRGDAEALRPAFEQMLRTFVVK